MCGWRIRKIGKIEKKPEKALKKIILFAKLSLRSMRGGGIVEGKGIAHESLH